MSTYCQPVSIALHIVSYMQCPRLKGGKEDWCSNHSHYSQTGSNPYCQNSHAHALCLQTAVPCFRVNLTRMPCCSSCLVSLRTAAQDSTRISYHLTSTSGVKKQVLALLCRADSRQQTLQAVGYMAHDNVAAITVCHKQQQAFQNVRGTSTLLHVVNCLTR